MAENVIMRAAVVAMSVRDAEVQRLIGGRFYENEPPDNAAFPYVTMGRSERNGDGTLYLTTLHVWSRTGGRAENLDVISALRSALNRKPITLGPDGDGEIDIQFTDVFRSGDGRTVHGVMRIRCSATAPLSENTDLGSK